MNDWPNPALNGRHSAPAPVDTPTAGFEVVENARAHPPAALSASSENETPTLEAPKRRSWSEPRGWARPGFLFLKGGEKKRKEQRT